MSAPKAVQNECLAGELVFAETIKFHVSATIWSHAPNWGATITFSEFVAVEAGDTARLRVLRKGEFPLTIGSVVRHEGGETTISFDGAGPSPSFAAHANGMEPAFAAR